MTTLATQLAGSTAHGDHDYPTSDGRPVGETDLHRNVMFETIETLKAYYAGQQVYVTGNLLLFYEQGNRRRHVAPDAMVVLDWPSHERVNYLLWQKKVPNVVVEITSASTRKEDLEVKWRLYQDVIKVTEYFLFDPWGEYLVPRLQGYRLVGVQYEPIKDVMGLLHSKELGLHFKEVGKQLRFIESSTGRQLETPGEARERAERQLQRAESEIDRLRRELEQVNQKLDEKSP
jgi:Uma2 family endonuclease